MAKKKKKVVAKKVVKKKVVAKKAKPVVKKKKVVAKKSVAKPALKTKAVKTVVAKTVKPIDLKNFVTPLDDRLIVQVEDQNRMTAGGLYIPDTVADARTFFKGVILAVGRGHRDVKGRVRPMDVKVGDKVLFNSISGAKLTYQNVDLKILRETDVMGVIDKD